MRHAIHAAAELLTRRVPWWAKLLAGALLIVAVFK